ncbi:receptor-type tyrosine-protein phosphatase epsilon isoform X2 [Magallana gigas]|uniref:receptor-type tyrosine-protein phosphatase epsilon isoform X2 n=1 Tax=Magallana gigas TaxID=29159 RepID=UPI00333E7D2B
MATKDAQSAVLLLLLSSVSVLSYLQFVNPGVTQANSSLIHGFGGTYPYWPNRTVDGNFSQTYTACLHTAVSDVTEAWLRIDLQYVRSIKSVKFWYRGDRGSVAESTIRLRGYSICVSNTTNVSLSSTDACFTDDMSHTLPTVIQEDCKRTTRYIWFYQPKVRSGDDSVPILEICEVQIFGCETGTYDINCTKTCSHCKNSETCDIYTGECDDNGCALPGFKSPLCSECGPGYHGSDCSLKCSLYCEEKVCDRYSGECLYGCTPGYQMPDCVKPCMHGYYGENCTKTCGNCLNKETCNNVNGTCTDGCSEGYKGDLCTTECSSYEYGQNCLNRCSSHCYNNETCDTFFGNCSRCADGYQDAKCDKKCNDGAYGENCTYQCGECLNAVICNHVNGTCPKGCKPGWQNTDKCDKPCRNGTFGSGCKFICSGNCENNDTCDRTNGACLNCAPGWENQYCNKTCDVGWYGSNCMETCGRCLEVENCSITNGSCFGGCMEGYTGDACHERIQSLLKEPESPSAAVIAAPVVVIVVLITVIVVVVILRKRQPSKKNKLKEHSLQLQAIPEQEEEVEMPCGDEVYYTNHQIHTKHIKIRELRSVIHSLEHDIEDGFEKEFRAIPFGESPEIPCTVGKLPENMVKNRFKTTFPYDHSRVILESTENGDYINANFIKNAYGETAYIASQGPRANTVVDFWQMVWQENVSVIAMVTNLMEGATVKCERYWPEIDGSKITKGKFSIHLVSTKTYAYFAIHQLKVANNQIKKSRLITHLQYTGWPDHGTPSPLELLAYHRYVSLAVEKRPESKLVVHCSAGIGRTGTFIALDALQAQGERDGRINIVEFVHTMREDRMNMIQNANQFRFLYYVLHENVRAKGRVRSKTDFIQEVESEISSNKAVNLSKFMKEFNELASIKTVFEEKDMQFGKQNQSLNMSKNVLPADKMRIILSSHVPGRSTYVNAVPISTFTMKDCMIAGQYPVQGAAIDLIRLLIDQECSFMVSINPLSEIPSTVEWFSLSDRRRELFNFEVEIMSSSKISDNVRKSSVRIKTASSNDWQEVTIYEITSWHFKEDLPAETNPILELVKFIMQGPKIDPENKMVVLSRDGATGCGVLFAVYNAIQQLQQDQEVDMFTIVRQLQSRRPEMITSMNEYTFCCQAVAQFIKSDTGMEDVYMNSQPENDESIYANV